MIDPKGIDYAAIAGAARHGSPFVTEVAGRFLGFGQAERDQLSQGRVPGWVMLLGGLSVGLVIGVRMHKHWGTRIPKIISG